MVDNHIENLTIRTALAKPEFARHHHAIIKKMDVIALDAQRQKQAKKYASIRRRLMLVDLSIGIVYLVAWLFTGWSIDLRHWLLTFTSSHFLLLTGFLGVFGGIFFLVNLPLAYYSGFVLPHSFGQSNQALKGWLLDQLKGLSIAGLIGLILVQIIYMVLRTAPDTWWLWAAAILLFFNILMANLAPVLIAPLFYKFQSLHESRADLSNRLAEMARRAGVRVRGVYRFDMSRRTKSANAALFGLGNTRRIILGDTLLTEFTDDEIETVLAHELGHHAHNDIPLSIVTTAVINLLGLYLAAAGLRLGVQLFGFSGPADIAAIPLLALILGAFGLLTMPAENAFSRWRERMADRYALQLTGKKEAFATAFTRLANQNLAEVDPEPWVVFLFYSHPPLGERIQSARSA
ncbi:MAG TPA: M48 family metallopeptidase [Levilinea sp.]|nr:M48 family metallopeptidase [Levilinea sp.]